MKTRSELVTEFRDWTDQPNTAIISATLANREINRAYKQLITKINEWNYRFFFTSTTVSTAASTAYASVPTDSVLINKLVDADKVILPNKDIELFDHGLTNGEPIAWDTAGRRIYFNPIPDAIYAYTCWYTYAPSELSTDAATPEFVPGYEGIIAIKAAINSKMIRDEQTREMAQLQYFEDLKSLRLAVMTQQTSASRRVLSSSCEIDE